MSATQAHWPVPTVVRAQFTLSMNFIVLVNVIIKMVSNFLDRIAPPKLD